MSTSRARKAGPRRSDISRLISSQRFALLNPHWFQHNARPRRGKRNLVLQEVIVAERSGEWVRKWGYKGINKSGENDWLVEVDDQKEKLTGEAGDVRKERRAERMERMRRQERKQRANERSSIKPQG